MVIIMIIVRIMKIIAKMVDVTVRIMKIIA